MIEEQMPIAVPSDQLLPMQCYVQPFWKHSDIEIYNESNLDTMARMLDNCIDLTITSPPYDDLRNYKGFSFPFEDVAKELLRITKPGGVLVWVVGDSTKNGSESLTSFKQALFFNSIGFNVHDTMIYQKLSGLPLNHNRYEQDYEFMFVLSKGKPKTFNPIKVKTITNEKRDSFFGTHDEKNNKRRSGAKRTDTKPEKIKGNIWGYRTGLYHSTYDAIAFKHPAVFPEQLATDHIQSWSNEGDVIYEPFGGSGTVAKMCYLLNRKCIVSEITKDYCELSVQRLSPYTSQSRLFA